MRTINLTATIDVDDSISEEDAILKLMSLFGPDVFNTLPVKFRNKFHPKEVSAGTDQVITLPATEAQNLTPRMKFIRREAMVDQLIYILKQIDKLNTDLNDPEWSADIMCLVDHHRHVHGQDVHDECIKEHFHIGSFSGFGGGLFGIGLLAKTIVDEQE